MTTTGTGRHGRAFDRVLIIMFENMYRSYVMQNPYMRQLARHGIDLANSHGVMHPSQTNYIASVAGELCNVSDDEPPAPLPQRTIVDLLEDAGLSWKAYMDSYAPATMPWAPDLVPTDDFPYVLKHNPFSSFVNIVESSERWSRIVSAHQLLTDAASGSLPEYAWLTPDMWNDGHYLAGTTREPEQRAPALVDQLSAWLEYFFRMLRFPGPDSVLPDGTLVVVTFDEADFEAAYAPASTFKYTYDGPNQVYTVLLGSMVTPGVQTGSYNHYSLLRTIQENFGLGSLGKNDAHASWYRFLWGQRFAWGAPQRLPYESTVPVGVAAHQVGVVVVFEDPSGLLLAGDGGGGAPHPIGTAHGPTRALATHGEVLYLLEGTGTGLLQRTNDGSGWSSPERILACGPVRDLAVATIDDGRQRMVCWSDADGHLWSLVGDSTGWADTAVAVGPEGAPFQTHGGLALGVLGSCVLCIYTAADHRTMMAVSYNTADFNVVSIDESTEYSGPYNDTTKDRWSPSAFPVERFASAPSPVSPGEPEPVAIAYPGRSPLVTATLDGVLHLCHPTPDHPGVVCETLALSGLLTPALPVAYTPDPTHTTSNGYGTLAQAGWSPQTEVEGAVLSGDPALASCVGPDRLYLVHRSPSGHLALQLGAYTPLAPHRSPVAPETP